MRKRVREGGGGIEDNFFFPYLQSLNAREFSHSSQRIEIPTDGWGIEPLITCSTIERHTGIDARRWSSNVKHELFLQYIEFSGKALAGTRHRMIVVVNRYTPHIYQLT